MKIATSNDTRMDCYYHGTAAVVTVVGDGWYPANVTKVARNAEDPIDSRDSSYHSRFHSDSHS